MTVLQPGARRVFERRTAAGSHQARPDHERDRWTRAGQARHATLDFDHSVWKGLFLVVVFLAFAPGVAMLRREPGASALETNFDVDPVAGADATKRDVGVDATATEVQNDGPRRHAIQRESAGAVDVGFDVGSVDLHSQSTRRGRTL